MTKYCWWTKCFPSRWLF